MPNTSCKVCTLTHVSCMVALHSNCIGAKSFIGPAKSGIRLIAVHAPTSHSLMQLSAHDLHGCVKNKKRSTSLVADRRKTLADSHENVRVFTLGPSCVGRCHRGHAAMCPATKTQTMSTAADRPTTTSPSAAEQSTAAPWTNLACRCHRRRVAASEQRQRPRAAGAALAFASAVACS